MKHVDSGPEGPDGAVNKQRAHASHVSAAIWHTHHTVQIKPFSSKNCSGVILFYKNNCRILSVRGRVHAAVPRPKTSHFNGSRNRLGRTGSKGPTWKYETLVSAGWKRFCIWELNTLPETQTSPLKAVILHPVVSFPNDNCIPQISATPPCCSHEHEGIHLLCDINTGAATTFLSSVGFYIRQNASNIKAEKCDWTG